MAYQNYGQQYYLTQTSFAQSGGDQPITEVNGKLQFTLPGEPVFPALADDTILKPTLSWELETNKPGAMPAEFSYVTEGMRWEASYNVVAPPKGNFLELVGWVTLDNESGKSFRDARIRLMAGDVNKIEPPGLGARSRNAFALQEAASVAPTPLVRERTFDEYHLYTLEHTTTLHDREIKQVEFVRAAGIQSKTLYVYDGVGIDPAYRGWNIEIIRQQDAYGVKSNPKVWAMQELKNSKENHLGMPLPKGRVRFYRRDDDGQLEFTGENEIDHTPKDELLWLYTGNAFDMTVERYRLQYRIDTNGRWVDESFEIKVRNHKVTAVEARIIEHIYRWSNWEISKNPSPFNKVDSQTIEFTVQPPPGRTKDAELSGPLFLVVVEKSWRGADREQDTARIRSSALAHFSWNNSGTKLARFRRQTGHQCATGVHSGSALAWRRNAALSSGRAVLMNIPEPISKPAIRETRGIMLTYQW